MAAGSMMTVRVLVAASRGLLSVTADNVPEGWLSFAAATMMVRVEVEVRPAPSVALLRGGGGVSC
jgi:hypothetical protein